MNDQAIKTIKKPGYPPGQYIILITCINGCVPWKTILNIN